MSPGEYLRILKEIVMDSPARSFVELTRMILYSPPVESGWLVNPARRVAVLRRPEYLVLPGSFPDSFEINSSPFFPSFLTKIFCGTKQNGGCRL
jgi:hypothetical protein